MAHFQKRFDSKRCAARFLHVAMLTVVCLYATFSIPIHDRSRVAVGGEWYRQGWPFPFLTRRVARDAAFFGISPYACGTQWWLAIADIAMAVTLSFLASKVFIVLTKMVNALLHRRRPNASGFMCGGIFAGVLCIASAKLVFDGCIDQKTASQMRDMGCIVYAMEGEAVPECVYRVLVDLGCPGRKWLRRVVHVEYCAPSSYRGVALMHPDTLLSTLGESFRCLRYCESVVIKDHRLTDAGVASLCANLPTCRFLELEGSRAITDVSLKRISDTWPQLEVLAVSGSRITDDGLKVLVANCHLNTVSLCNTCAVSVDGVMLLCGMPHIKHIKVPTEVLTDEQFLSVLDRRPDLSLSCCD